MTSTIASMLLTALCAANFAPTWESLDARDNPQWFEDAKFGIFIHWGVYSVPAWGPKDRYSEWYWHDMQNKKGETWKFHRETYGEAFQYQDFADDFSAELFDPKQWADIFKRSGARYVVLTSKHHEGFCLWPNEEAWNWNSVDIGPHRDLCGDLTEAVRDAGLRMGFYYSLYEWFNPLYRRDVDAYVDQHMLPQLKDLVQRYKPDIIWPDGEWAHPSETWRSTEFLAWLFNESNAPDDVVINDRWGKGARNTHGGFATPEYGHIDEGRLIQAGRFEECQGMGKSFGYNRNEDVDSYRTATELLHLLIDNVSRGGNLLLDIGPTADGRIPVIMQQRLIDMGKWLEINGDAIYGTEALANAPEIEDIRFTRKGDTVYAIALTWPKAPIAIPALAGKGFSKGVLLGHEGTLDVKEENGATVITPPAVGPTDLPCDHAWVFKLTP
jgi:alpha-L-fucosidase